MRPQKQSHQLKALLYKNIRLQARQPCTNLCQIFTPIICLFFTILIRDVVIDKIPDNDDNVFVKFPLVPVKFNNYTLIDSFLPGYINRDCHQWYEFDMDEKVDIEFIGERDGLNNNSGLLGQINDTFYRKCNFNFSRTQSPLEGYYPPVMKPANRSINKDLFEVTNYLNAQNRSDMRRYNNLHQMPDGGIYFRDASPEKLSVNLQVMDIRNLDYYRSDGISKISYYSEKTNSSAPIYTVPQGLLSMQNLISGAFLQQITDYNMQSGVMYMPPIQSAPVLADLLINAIAGVLFPISLSLLLPVFLYLIVLEKEEKLIQMMRMNGMKMRNYWFVNFVFDLVIGLLTNLVFYLFGVIFLGGAVFDGTSPSVLLVIMLGWILDQIAMATFFQTFITSSRAANIIGYLLSIWTNLIGATLSLALYQYPRSQPTYFSIYPTFALDRLFYLMLTKCTDDRCYRSLSGLDEQARTCIIVLYAAFFIFQILGMYLFEIVPQEFGVKQKVTFPIDFLINKFKGPSESQQDTLAAANQFNEIAEEQIHQNSDSFAKKELDKIHQVRNLGDHALIIKKLRKVYDNGKEAVKGMDLLVEDKQVFGLLGPNGAGKTTLISMITGIFEPTKGECIVAGHSIKEDIEQVHINIGVCPQFDILWPQLSVEQHLYFYARLRGISRQNQERSVEQALKQVNLEKFRKFDSSQLSGGMKRRLSVGISMVGNPRIVFLDEPTTGLDPQNRRHLWEVLNNCRKERSLFLTTHLMQEADALCNRVGIITKGVLRTVGTQQQLKKTYGKGYCLSLNIEVDEEKQHHKETMFSSGGTSSLYEQNERDQSMISEVEGDIPNVVDYKRKHVEHKRKLEEKITMIKSKIKEMFPCSILDREINGYLSFQMENIVVSQVLRKLNNCEVEEISSNWGLSNSSLEDVFLAVVKQFEGEDEKSSLLSDQNVILSGDRVSIQAQQNEEQ